MEENQQRLTIRAVNEDRDALRKIASLAEQIWHQHYTPIIGKEQVLYMLDKFQSMAAMQEQIQAQGYLYFQLNLQDALVGYFAVQYQDDCLFLSKLYLAEAFRGLGLARLAQEYIAQLAQQKQKPRIRLTVNKFNRDSILAYEKLGYAKVKDAVFDIGAGYVMDDFVMEKNL